MFNSSDIIKGLTVCAAGICLVVAAPAWANAGGCKNWFVESGATGNGTKANDPFGSLEDAYLASDECDTIQVLPSAMPLDGGITLKDKQQLIGRGANPDNLSADANSGHYALIANSASGGMNNGDAIICEGECTIRKIWVTSAFYRGVNALWGSGDMSIKQSRISNFNTSGELFDSDPAVLQPYGGIEYARATHAEVQIHQVLMEDGPASGILVRSLGSSEIELHIEKARLYRLIFPGVADMVGIRATAEDSSVLRARVRNSRIEQLSTSIIFGPGARFPDAMVLLAAGTNARMDATIKNNDIVDSGFFGIVVGSIDHGASNHFSGSISNNTVSFTENAVAGFLGAFGIDLLFVSSSTEDQVLTVKNNTVEAWGRPVNFELVGGRTIVDVLNNDVTIIAGNPFPTGFPAAGIDVAIFAPGNMSSQVTVERNSVQAVGPVEYTQGIGLPFLVPEGSPGNIDLVVRHNRIEVGEATIPGLLNGGLFYGPNLPGPVLPEYNATFLVEHNCVENSDVGFLLGTFNPSGVWPADPNTQVIDLGGGPLGSAGGNSFLNTTFDFLFVGPTVPTTVWAKNNFFDDNNPMGDPYAAVIGDFSLPGNTPLEVSNPPLQTGVMNCDDVF